MADLNPIQDDSMLAAIQADALTRVLPAPAARAVAPGMLPTPTAGAGTNLYIHKELLPKDFVIRAGFEQPITLERETVLVFADDAPLYNWAHPCRYLLYAPDQQLYREVPAQFPPKLQESPAFQIFHQAVAFTGEHEHTQAAVALRGLVESGVRYVGAAGGTRYALLYSGHSDNRHVNDMEFLYRTLVDLYDFDPQNIYILNYDGTINYQKAAPPLTWPGDNSQYRMKVTGAGTGTDLDKAFDTLKARLGANDFLLIHTNNHGFNDGTESHLCAHDPKTHDWGTSIPASHFADKLKSLPKFAQLMVMMEQCEAGGFNGPVIAHSPATQTTIASACQADKGSAGGSEYDPFALSWISAVTGVIAGSGSLVFNPDADHNRIISAREAFDYAQDSRVNTVGDTPVYDETPKGCGKEMTLGRPETRVLRAPDSPVIGVRRSADTLDVFVVGQDGATSAAAWDQHVASGHWRGWWPINGGQAAPKAPLTAVARDTTHLDVFVTGTDGGIWTAAWDANVDKFVGQWRGWWRILNAQVQTGTMVSAVARAPTQLDIFISGTDGSVWTAAWDHNVAKGQWRGWWLVPGSKTVAGGAVTAVARSPHQLDIFMVGQDGIVHTAAWDQNVDSGKWRGWWPVGTAKAKPGSVVSAVARSPHQLDIFMVGQDGVVYTAAWDQNVDSGKWRGWWPIGGTTKCVAGGTVTGVSRDPNKLDVFMVGADGVVYTAAWDQNVAKGAWRGWWPIVNGKSVAGVMVSAASRDPNKLDVFTIGPSGDVCTAAWDQNVASGHWRGWWPIPG